jgi:hypothetical protein
MILRIELSSVWLRSYVENVLQGNAVIGNFGQMERRDDFSPMRLHVDWSFFRLFAKAAAKFNLQTGCHIDRD